MSGKIHLELWIKDQPREDALEPVHARQLDDGNFEILSTPGFALDVAAGDVVRMVPDRPGNFEVIRRGGNVALQVHSQVPIDQLRDELTPQIELIGGWLDGSIDRGVVYTIPAQAGFGRIEAIANRVVNKYPKPSGFMGTSTGPRTE